MYGMCFFAMTFRPGGFEVNPGPNKVILGLVLMVAHVKAITM